MLLHLKKVCSSILIIIALLPTAAWGVPLQETGNSSVWQSSVEAIETASEERQLEVHFIDVEQGDSIFIKFPNGKTMLVDAGDRKAGEKVVEYLKRAGVSTIDQVVATHPDIDHIGGFLEVFTHIGVKKLLDSGKTYTTDTYAEYLKLVALNEIPTQVAEEGQQLYLDPDVKVQVLHVNRNEKENNPASIVLKLSYGDMDVLLTSDTEEKNEKRLIKRYDVQAEILKVAHHGSATSNSQAFVDAVNPEAAVFSYDQANDYGHPVPKVVARLYHLGTALYSTAESGDIVASIDEDGYVIDADPYDPGFAPGPDEE
ncbi:ComEC/Rec2 family competence protein [Thalassobacillus devorans]|uniref:ComEC/Rec2 family competence protein n=1 Tax=Thalassobacillus devorans TaxID=279813 RepID=UPI0004B0D793|nr:ComEC/Rec2 family competence protein [Thalassobacillus devorans]